MDSNSERWKAWVRRGFERLALARPQAGLRWAGSIGRWSPPSLVAGPTAREIAALFPDLPEARVRAIGREMRAGERRNQALLHLINERGVEPVLPLLDLVDAGGLRSLKEEPGPTILVLWHAGVPQAELPALVALGIPVVVADYPSPHPSEIIRYYPIGTPSGRVVFLKNALGHLRKGGLVLLNIDGPMGEGHVELPFLGRRVSVGRGAGTLARLSGARLLPVTTGWVESGPRIRVSVHEALPLPDLPRSDRRYEEAALEIATRWFEAFLRDHPERLRYRWLRGYLASEPWS